MLHRCQVFEGSGTESVFLWGARQTGKSTLLKAAFPHAMYYDLLLNHEYQRLLSNPDSLRESVLAKPNTELVIIDEIQRLPMLLNEVHWLLSNTRTRVIMSGSSARKILRSETNLLGGRALRYELFPLVSAEIPDFDLLRALNNGLLPRHYAVNQPKKLLNAYIGNYLRDEIAAEARLRNVAAFSRFLETAAFSNGEMVNYSNIAGDTGVSLPTVKEYFQILEDTLLGRYVPAFRKKAKRRVILAPKFYLFDVGVANALLRRGRIESGSEIFGKAFEHFIYQEICAHSSYSDLHYPIAYWRTASQFEVDFVLGDHEVAVEVKGSNNIQPRHLSGLKAFAEEFKSRKQILVCNEPRMRKVDKILVMPWKEFLSQLWSGDIVR
jgi:predicted AAA+ superfamily ATPase